MADQWRVRNNFHHSGGGSVLYITNNWERNDSHNLNPLVGANWLTQNSGIFSFPSTGVFLITYNFQARNQQPTVSGTDQGAALYAVDNGAYTGYPIRYIAIGLETTIDNEQSWGPNNWAHESVHEQSNAYVQLGGSYLFKVTDTANCKFRFTYQAARATTFMGEDTRNYNFLTVVQLL